MKLIVVDLDRLKYKKPKRRKNGRIDEVMRFNDKCVKEAFRSVLTQINDNKICSLLPRDFGKKTLIGLPKNDPICLKANKKYKDAIFKLKDDDSQLLHENRMFRHILKERRIKWFRVGVILRREKAIKILQRMLHIT